MVLFLFFIWRVYFCCCGALLVECCAVFLQHTHIYVCCCRLEFFFVVVFWHGFISVWWRGQRGSMFSAVTKIHKTAKRAFFISKFNVPSFNFNLSVCVLYNLTFLLFLFYFQRLYYSSFLSFPRSNHFPRCGMLQTASCIYIPGSDWVGCLLGFIRH